MQIGIPAFSLGVALLQTQASLPGVAALSVLAALALLAVCGARRGGRLRRRGGAVIAGVLAGFVWAAACATLRLADALPTEAEMRDVELVGVVAALPQRFDRGERFEFDVEQVLTSGLVVPRRILLAWYHGWDEVDARDAAADDAADEPVSAGPAARALHPGERWRFTVRLKRPHGLANPHAHDHEVWLLERNLRATGTIRLKARNVRLDAFVWRPAYAVERARDAIRERFLRTLPEGAYRGVLVALAVGDQRAIDTGELHSSSALTAPYFSDT